MSKTLKIRTNGTWTATPKDSWLKVEPSNGTASDEVQELTLSVSGFNTIGDIGSSYYQTYESNIEIAIAEDSGITKTIDVSARVGMERVVRIENIGSDSWSGYFIGYISVNTIDGGTYYHSNNQTINGKYSTIECRGAVSDDSWLIKGSEDAIIDGYLVYVDPTTYEETKIATQSSQEIILGDCFTKYISVIQFPKKATIEVKVNGSFITTTGHYLKTFEGQPFSFTYTLPTGTTYSPKYCYLDVSNETKATLTFDKETSPTTATISVDSLLAGDTTVNLVLNFDESEAYVYKYTTSDNNPLTLSDAISNTVDATETTGTTNVYVAKFAPSNGKCRSFYNTGDVMTSALTSLVLDENITTIPDETFSGCQALSSLTVGANVTSWGVCLGYCNSLERITFKGTTAQWLSISKPSTWLNYYRTDIVTGDCYLYIDCTDGTIAYYVKDGTYKIVTPDD